MCCPIKTATRMAMADAETIPRGSAGQAPGEVILQAFIEGYHTPGLGFELGAGETRSNRRIQSVPDNRLSKSLRGSAG